MAILKTDILTDANVNLRRNESDIDVQIQKILDDLSEANLLLDTDTTQTLISGGKTLNYPTGFRNKAIITLTDTGGNQGLPLRKLPGGHFEYRQQMSNNSSVGVTEWFSEYNKQFHLIRPVDRAYTTLIEYRKNHPALSGDTGSIEFDDMFRNAIYAGVTYQVAQKFKLRDYMGIWLPVYVDAKRKRINSVPQQPSIVFG